MQHIRALGIGLPYPTSRGHWHWPLPHHRPPHAFMTCTGTTSALLLCIFYYYVVCSFVSLSILIVMHFYCYVFSIIM
jgi:hypothetical protein